MCWRIPFPRSVAYQAQRSRREATIIAAARNTDPTTLSTAVITTELSPTKACRIACPTAEIKKTTAMMTNTAGSCSRARRVVDTRTTVESFTGPPFLRRRARPSMGPCSSTSHARRVLARPVEPKDPRWWSLGSGRRCTRRDTTPRRGPASLAGLQAKVRMGGDGCAVWIHTVPGTPRSWGDTQSADLAPGRGAFVRHSRRFVVDRAKPYRADRGATVRFAVGTIGCRVRGGWQRPIVTLSDDRGTERPDDTGLDRLGTGPLRMPHSSRVDE